MANLNDVANAVEFLLASRSGTRLDDEDLTRLLKAYALVLSPIPTDLLWKAALDLSRHSGDFLPGAGQIYTRALELADDTPTVEEAWPDVLAVICGKPRDLHPRAARALEALGGAATLQDATKNDIYRAQFFKQYERERERDMDTARQNPKFLESGRLLIEAGRE